MDIHNNESKNLEKKYQSLLKESQDNGDILGLFLGGSRGKDSDFITSESDFDVYVVLHNSASQETKKKVKDYFSDYFDVRVFLLREFRGYANWGSEHVWDRYNFTHNEPVVDKTGELEQIMAEKGRLPEGVQSQVTRDYLDDYINSVYRSAKYYRDREDVVAYLDAVESLPSLMTALYALEGRLRPYNKYFEWELRHHPLDFFPFDVEEFISDYIQILQTGDFKAQKKIFKVVKKLFIKHGYEDVFNDWEGKYFVGE